jgi:hypothetical protein
MRKTSPCSKLWPDARFRPLPANSTPRVVPWFLADKALEAMFFHKKALEPCFGYIFCVLAPLPPFQVALGSYQLKLHNRTNVEHGLCFIVYLNIEYD